jgi:hypothetical protein
MRTGGEWRADSTHNHILSVTNSGQKPADTLLSLHYGNGAKTYEMQQTIAPGDQMWVNLASLIRNRVPDRKGDVLPADLASGTYDVQQINVRQINSAPRSLSLAGLAVDQTWGYQIAPPNDICCSDQDPGWDQNIFDLALGDTTSADIDAVDSCGGSIVVISNSFPDWFSDNTSVAVVSKQKIQAVGVGTTTGSADGHIFVGDGGYCAVQNVQENVPINVSMYTAVDSLTPLSLTLLFPALETGIGTVATMEAGPSSQDWNGDQLQEVLATSSNSCPTNWGNICAGGSTFTIGNGGQAQVSVNGLMTPVGPVFPGEENLFYDQHTATATASLLNTSNINSCTTVCGQTYLWNGIPTGTDTITYSFIQARINGTNVTSVEVSKQ